METLVSNEKGCEWLKGDMISRRVINIYCYYVYVEAKMNRKDNKLKPKGRCLINDSV